MKYQPFARSGIRPESFIWLALPILAPFYFLIPITHDAAWQMWIARQMLLGANLYSDIIEVNPPLWFWLALPLAAVAKATGIASLAMLVGFFLGCITLSLWLCVRLGAERRVLLAAAVAMLVLPIQDFGQREQFAMISTIPYVVLTARRRDGTQVPIALAIGVGVFAAIGFALKPHFVLVPLALELWLRQPWRIEFLTLLAGAAAYALAVVILEPDYFTKALPIVITAYGQFSGGRSSFWAGAAAFAVALAFRPSRSATPFLIAALAFYLGFVWQLKWWPYQLIPALGLLLIAVSLQRPKTPVGRALMVASFIVILGPNLRLYETPPKYRFDIPRGASFAALSTSPRAAWPLVEKRHLRWTLPYMCLWMWPTVDLDPISTLKHDPPDFLLIQRPFSARDLLWRYRPVATTDSVTLYRRIR